MSCRDGASDLLNQLGSLNNLRDLPTFSKEGSAETSVWAFPCPLRLKRVQVAGIERLALMTSAISSLVSGSCRLQVASLSTAPFQCQSHKRYVTVSPTTADYPFST